MLRSVFVPLLALVLCAGFVGAQEVANITIGDLNKAITAKAVTVIDVNGAASFAQGHVPGALDFSVVKDDIAKHLPADKSALIVAYCSSPRCGAYKRATNAAVTLGYTNVKHLSAGISGWRMAAKEGLVSLGMPAKAAAAAHSHNGHAHSHAAGEAVAHTDMKAKAEAVAAAGGCCSADHALTKLAAAQVGGDCGTAACGAAGCGTTATAPAVTETKTVGVTVQ